MNGDSEYPLLILPRPRTIAERERLPGGGGNTRRPGSKRQGERLSPKFRQLRRSFTAAGAQVQTEPSGTSPEQVLVLETIGTVEDFIRAVQRIDGLEYLGEFDETDIPPDDDFFDPEDRTKRLSGTVYLMMSNREAMEQLLSLWRRFTSEGDVEFAYGLNRFRELFATLREIRPWGPEDRLRETGVLRDWQERIQLGFETVPAEIELWFREDTAEQVAAEEEVRGYVAQAGGEVVASSTIREIRYHAVLARLPVSAVAPLLTDISAAELVRSDRIMLVRPAGQSVVVPKSEGTAGPIEVPPPGLLQDAVAALFDGVPLEQHEVLAARLTIDDPDDYVSDAPAARRRHGTAMASLILHGDLAAPGPPLASRLYVRPILTPGPDWVPRAPEQVPDGVLVVDLVHRAVRRMFEAEPDVTPRAPTVRILNLSIGDRAAPYGRLMSSWARLIDWIAWRYKVLVIVSAGNHSSPIELSLAEVDFSTLDPQELEKLTLQALADGGWGRRLLPPAESMNALTVGASPQDSSVTEWTDRYRELITSPSLPAPYSALGLGHRRSIKPDVLMPGGRFLYEATPRGDADGLVTAAIVDQPASPPGQMVASPAGIPGSTGGIQYWAGTSNAAALTTRLAVQLHDMLSEIRDGSDGGTFLQDPGVLVTTLKALLVHGAEHGEGLTRLVEALDGRVEARKVREYICRFLGYGLVHQHRSFGSEAQRVTMIGGGALEDEHADIYQIPLPPSLSGAVGRRRLTITLAWFTPTNARNRRYRRARLWFRPPQDELRVARKEADWRAVQRGTVQHEILEGEQAAIFQDGDRLLIQVNCKADAGTLDQDVQYGLAISLETAPELGLPVFVEVRDRVRPLIPVRPGA